MASFLKKIDILFHFLESHIKSVHGKDYYECDKCDYKASRKDSLNTHTKSVHDQSKFQCEQCNYKASRKHHLQSHVKSQHDKNQMNIEIFLRNIQIYD